MKFFFAILLFVFFSLESQASGTEFTVLGLNSERALALEPLHPNDHPCSPYHEQGDFLNKWCHIGTSKVFYTVLKEQGFSDIVAHAGGLLLFGVKEMFDLNYDWSDVNTAPITLYESELISSAVAFTMDGGVYYSFTRKF